MKQSTHPPLNRHCPLDSLLARSRAPRTLGCPAEIKAGTAESAAGGHVKPTGRTWVDGGEGGEARKRVTVKGIRKGGVLTSVPQMRSSPEAAPPCVSQRTWRHKACMRGARVRSAGHKQGRPSCGRYLPSACRRRFLAPQVASPLLYSSSQSRSLRCPHSPRAACDLKCRASFA
jgi:hypothetical protein